ncbi:GH92 family glycosyl hydrolase [Terriglobus saanensis]|uniref:Alpha-1,2-mannosidase n=1 Tax=Terriglobus saanensis (strain ATCC BAA-1853 / DSM 23119 / SP1PR4) TaxID=401053 RepID=E8UZA2_TERSS|nr:GH92 family glycosyl hydrolase [Terriglobus saanensis]ADV82120.1 alpha-1,2-mannosidase [Terriglobus saanensis SP1PR4]
MFNRRDFLGLVSLAAGHQALAQSATVRKATKSASKPAGDVTKWVNLAIGTGGHGHTFPGATVPFGAVQLSPDTYNEGWDWCSGYYTTDTSIMGFSHTHLSGTGASDLLDILLVPRVGDVKLVPGSRENPEEGYRSRFTHATEVLEPGYYSVMLDTPGIKAELTTTERTGFHRYTFPANETSHFVLDLFHSAGNPEKTVGSAEIKIVGTDTITGGRVIHNWAPTRQIYFAMQFSKPFASADLYSNQEKQSGTEVKGKMLHAVVHYKTADSEKILVKVGISMVSAENAMLNLKKEQPAWAFDQTRLRAKQTWSRELSKMEIETDNENDKKIFYTAMYHMMCAPTLADDVNGQYRGMDQKVHNVDAGQHNYSTYSLWDTFRALHPSFTLWQQERVPQLVNCLVRMAEESPGGMPVWPLQGGETFCMTGYHSASVMAEACVKKFPGIDWNRAYKQMRKRNMDEDYEGLAFYRKLGYIPADKQGESVSKLIEYDYNDWACAHVADAVGRSDDAAIQRERSKNYRHLFDPETQFLRAKMSDGKWAMPFNPKATGHTKEHRDYTESNAWQSTFGVQHDVKGYIDLFGGREAYLKKLDDLFAQEPGVSNENVSDMTGFIGQYVHGNEPSHHILFLYVYAGQPWKTQQRVKEVLDTLYHNDLDGLSGNEDCGQMSAWYVMAALGLYAVDPVSATYVLTAPRFNRASVRVGGGRELVIEAKRTSIDDAFIQSVTLNGKPLDRLWVKHTEIANGAHLVFTLGAAPNKDLGADPAVAPPSLTA